MYVSSSDLIFTFSLIRPLITILLNEHIFLLMAFEGKLDKDHFRVLSSVMAVPFRPLPNNNINMAWKLDNMSNCFIFSIEYLKAVGTMSMILQVKS